MMIMKSNYKIFDLLYCILNCCNSIIYWVINMQIVYWIKDILSVSCSSSFIMCIIFYDDKDLTNKCITKADGGVLEPRREATDVR